jgi:hypothetical protein
MRTHRCLLLPIATALAAIGFVLASAAPVAAAVTSPGRSAYRPAPTAASAGAATATSAAVVSPSGCVQSADYPHQSTHVRGTMAGAIRARCRSVVPELSHSAQMWETRWWGWDRIGRKGSTTKYWQRGADAFATDTCKNATVRITGSGFVVDVDGKTYYSSTESKHVTNPCGL